MTTFQPVTAKQRVQIMDALRGFALLGIFIANLGSGFTFTDSGKADGPWITSWDGRMEWLHTLLLEGKFYSIFSFLFGWGFAIQLERSEGGELPPAKFMRRRLAVMLLLGLAHLILIWVGDIVAFYALMGFVLLWLRRFSDRTLLRIAILLLLAPIVIYFLKMKLPFLNAPAGWLYATGQKIETDMGFEIKSLKEFLAIYRQINWWDNIRMNVGGIFFRFGDLLFQSRAVKVLGMMTLGMLLGRGSRYRQILDNVQLLRTLLIAGLLVGLPANMLFVHFKELRGFYRMNMNGLYQTIFYALGVAPLAIAYMSGFALLARTRANAFLQWLQPMGKMAFTNYMLQSIVGTIFFSGIGFAWAGSMGAVHYTLFGLAVFIAQIFASALWLRYFQYGPVEWLWRSLTYRKRQPFLKEKG